MSDRLFDDWEKDRRAINAILSSETGKTAYANPEHYVEMRGPQKVKVIKRRNLWQSGLTDARTLPKKRGAAGIINCSGYTLNPASGGLPVLTLSMTDHDACPSEYFDVAVAFADATGPVWVNCFYGKNRSSAVAMAILMGCHRMSFAKSLKKVRRRPFDAHMDTLYRWGKAKGFDVKGVEL